MPKFIPLTMLKDTTGIVEFCQECGEPVFVTRNGTPELVIMDSDFLTSTCATVIAAENRISGENLRKYPKQSPSRN